MTARAGLCAALCVAMTACWSATSVAAPYGVVSIADDGSTSDGANLNDYWPFWASFDGSKVAFESRTDGEVYVRDQVTGRTVLASVGETGIRVNQAVRRFAMSSNARYLAFETTATDVVSGHTDGGFNNTYLRDLASGVTVFAQDSSQFFAVDDHGVVWPTWARSRRMAASRWVMRARGAGGPCHGHRHWCPYAGRHDICRRTRERPGGGWAQRSQRTDALSRLNPSLRIWFRTT